MDPDSVLEQLLALVEEEAGADPIRRLAIARGLYYLVQIEVDRPGGPAAEAAGEETLPFHMISPEYQDQHELLLRPCAFIEQKLRYRLAMAARRRQLRVEQIFWAVYLGAPEPPEAAKTAHPEARQALRRVDQFARDVLGQPRSDT